MKAFEPLSLQSRCAGNVDLFLLPAKGHREELHFWFSILPSLLVLLLVPPPHVALQLDHVDHVNGHDWVLHSLLSVWSASLIRICWPFPQDLLHGDQGDHCGWGHGWLLHSPLTVWPKWLTLLFSPPPQDLLHGDQGDQRNCSTDFVVDSSWLFNHCRI